MSYPYRQPVGAQPSVPVAQAPLSGRMVSPICTTGSPSVFPLMPNSYRFLPQQPQQYITQPVVYTLQNVQNTSYVTSAVTSTIPRMFVPVASVPGGISPASDPAKVLEKQRRYEKERNFQLQQERLKQFTVAGKKGSINAENLIDSMFGKFHPKKSSGGPVSFSPAKINDASEIKAKARVSSNETTSGSVSSVPYNTAAISTTPSNVPVKKDAKELDSMMLECSDLNAPSKATKFSKPSVKEMPSSSSHVATFAASNKARDWRNIQGLNNVFTAPKPRFPNWCVEEKVPELFRKIQAVVTNHDEHPPDTNFLFPILISSGLPREMLGQIWEIVNESASGQLTVNEMFAILALIALAQAGYPVKTVDVLHQLPSCPCPQLSVSSEVPASSKQSCGSAAAPITIETSVPHSSENQSVHETTRPTAISLTNIYQATNDLKDAASWKPLTDSITPQDDDFDEFKSATPTAINFSISTPTSIPCTEEDDFDDFKQASCVPISEITNPASLNSLNMFVKAKKIGDIATQQDLMSPEEDKYSVFRALQQNVDSNQWGDFTPVSKKDAKNLLVNEGENVGEFSDSKKDPGIFVTKTQDIADCFKENVKVENYEEDEFGDFIHANPSSVPSLLPTTTITDFADFSNFSQADCGQLATSQLDDEFGEFASSMPTSLKPEFGQEYLFRHLKDNISLTESQSVSSLELGTFDGGGGHSGESKSSLSRQGSIPSLDLKSVGLDGTDSEDCFAEIQLSTFVPRNSKSPSPITNKGSDDSESFTTPVFQASLPFTDKYSVIRQEKAKEEDQHITCWVRCLQSCINILQNTKKIFNQMSCSSVFNEVLTSEEGGSYVKNIIEVYKVVQRIGLASKSVSKQTETISSLLKEADQVWNTISGFFAGSVLMPEEASLDFSSAVLKLDPENNTKACGLCLLNVELQRKSLKQEHAKLSYGGRKYHSPCANFWVNCVDPLLPALTLPQLL